MKTIIVKCVKTCWSCPTQWECETDQGEFVYIRYRWDTLIVEKAVTEEGWKKGKVKLLLKRKGIVLNDRACDKWGFPKKTFEMTFLDLKELAKDRLFFRCKEELDELDCYKSKNLQHEYFKEVHNLICTMLGHDFMKTEKWFEIPNASLKNRKPASYLRKGEADVLKKEVFAIFKSDPALLFKRAKFRQSQIDMIFNHF